MQIAILLVDRANYGRLLPVIEAIDAAADMQHSIICGGNMVLPRFDTPADTLPFRVAAHVYHQVEGGTHGTMARSMGHATAGYAAALERLAPDYVVMIGDRYEAMGAALAVVALRIPLVHFQGGEHSGTLDNRWRWAITALADHHVPATANAADELSRRGATSQLTVGCPSSDLAKEIPRNHPRGRPLVIYHPDTATDADPAAEMREVLAAIDGPFDIGWPNNDPGADAIWREIRTTGKGERFINLSPRYYMRKLAGASVCVGNSSSFARDAGMVGTPVVLVGSRQHGRQTGDNVQRVPCDRTRIAAAIAQQAGRMFLRDDFYGAGEVAGSFVNALRRLHSGY